MPSIKVSGQILCLHYCRFHNGSLTFYARGTGETCFTFVFEKSWQNTGIKTQMRQWHLYNVEWVVQPAGRRRVLQEGRKNVHAFARGYIGDHSLGRDVLKDMFPVTYNPYKVKAFVRADTYEPVFNSQYAMLQSRDGRPYVEGN